MAGALTEVERHKAPVVAPNTILWWANSLNKTRVLWQTKRKLYVVLVYAYYEAFSERA